MWKLMNRLFGWDYIQWRNSAANGVARVHVDGLGRAYYWRYKITNVADIVENPKQVLWLTCHPHKYMAPPSADAYRCR